MAAHADVIVIGLGAMGSAVAYQAAKRGASVIGIDQFRPPHALGSSHGDSRITRQAIGEGAEYVRLVLRSHELWREIESETGKDILSSCGLVAVKGVSDEAGQHAIHGIEDWIGSTVQVAESFGIPHELFDGNELSSRYPTLTARGESEVYFEPGAGFVRPEAAICAQLQLAERHGADLRYGESVVEVTGKHDTAVITTNTQTLSAGQVVIAAGPWIGDLVREPELRRLFSVYRQVMHWFPVEPAEARAFSQESFPVFIWTFGEKDTDHFYGFPAIDGPLGGVKVASECYDELTSPHDVDRDVSSDEERSMYDRCIRGRVSGLVAEGLRSDSCLYTVTPDFRFVIDRHPEHASVWLVSPCSGHGFKHSAAIGESVAQAVLEGRSEIDISPFSFARFNQ